MRIDLGALRRNYRLLRALAEAGQSGSRLMPVLKSNAYGHGLAQVGRALRLEGAGHFAVGGVEEGVELRRALGGEEEAAPPEILALLGAAGEEEVFEALRHRISLLLFRPDQVDFLAGAARKAGRAGLRGPLRLAFKLNSGMNRLGFEAHELWPALEKTLRAGELAPVLLCAHLAAADLPEEAAYNRRQAGEFMLAWGAAARLSPALGGSLCNSAGLLRLPELLGGEEPLPSAPRTSLTHRPGLALYGANPFYGGALAGLGAGLSPVMALFAPVLELRDLPAGASLGYGRAFSSERALRVAIVRLGYADGLPRLLSNPGGCGEAVLAGRRRRILGRVCMQMLALEAPPEEGEGQQAAPGDWACFLGEASYSAACEEQPAPPGGGIRAEESAKAAGSIAYELFCSLGHNRKVFLE